MTPAVLSTSHRSSLSAQEVADRRVSHLTYTDLRAFAAGTTASSIQPMLSEGADPFAKCRRVLALSQPLLHIGCCSLPATSGIVGSFGHHELMIVIEGAITFQSRGQITALQAGSSIVVPKGASFRWHVADDAKFVFMSYHAEDATALDLIPVDPNVPLSPSGSPLADLLLSDTPSCRNNTLYATPSRHWSTGVWDSTPYHRAPMVYGHHELMHILEGSVCITDDLGRSTTFGRDAIVLVPQGARCSWLSKEHVRKVWGVLRIPT